MTEQMAQKWLEQFEFPTDENSDDALATICEALQEYPKFRAIGTVEELQALKEIVSMKNHESYCPNCKEVLTDDEFWALNMSVTHCENCGQAVQGTEYVD